MAFFVRFTHKLESCNMKFFGGVEREHQIAYLDHLYPFRLEYGIVCEKFLMLLVLHNLTIKQFVIKHNKFCTNQWRYRVVEKLCIFSFTNKLTVRSMERRSINCSRHFLHCIFHCISDGKHRSFVCSYEMLHVKQFCNRF